MGTRRKRPLGLVWDVIEHHHGMRNAFSAIHRTYEARVAKLVKERGIPRADLRLNPQETEDLFDTRRLDALIREQVMPLRDTAHALFRNSDVVEPYDSKVSRIYHELCILNEEHLSVRNFPREGSARQFARLFQEVSLYYPQRLRRVRDLVARAQWRLEEILPEFQRDAIVLRSSYVFRVRLWPEQARAGLVRFLGKMFPAEGAPYGFLKIAQSFFKAGFFEQAIEAAKMGVAAAAKQGSRTQQARDTVSDLDKLASRAEAERHALQEQDA